MEMVSVIKTPRVSVLMTIYNSENYLAEAIESILTQTYSDFEFLIIDDASTDRSPQILSEFALRDSRIQYEILPKNRGIGANRNALLKRAAGEYIAIMDGDDISMPERLALQIAYLDEHRECAVVGGQLVLIRENGNIFKNRVYSLQINNSEILMRSPVAQPASFFRKEVAILVGGYRDNMEVAEDYDLWLRIFAR
jgi:glycosyltransferase involved in cell wall biosynthesis